MTVNARGTGCRPLARATRLAADTAFEQGDPVNIDTIDTAVLLK